MNLPAGSLRKVGFIRKIIEHFSKPRAQAMVTQITPHLTKNQKIIDIGAGICVIDRILKTKGYMVTPVDIKDLSLYEDTLPIVYNGKRLPFKDDEFDFALLLDMLHHTPDPKIIIGEAKRVAKTLIIMEDIHRNQAQKYLTFAMDSILNLEFFGHPHTNKDDQGWKETFKSLNLKLLTSKYHGFWKFFEAATYVLERKVN